MSSIVSHSLVLIVVLSVLLSLVSGASYQLWSGSTTCSSSTSATGSGGLTNGGSNCIASSGASGIASVRLACVSSPVAGYAVQGFSDSACASQVTQATWTTTNSNNSYPCVAGIGTGSYSATLNCNSAFNLYTVSLPLMLLLSILVTLMI